jgi:hypothetical protein
MRAVAVIAVLSLFPAACLAGDKLTTQERIALIRGLMAEYGKAKVLVPRSRGALEIDAVKGFDKARWDQIAKKSGPAARAGELLQITKMDIGDDRIELQLNGGYNGGRHWYRNIQMGGGASDPVMTPIAGDDSDDPMAPYGTSIVILFHKPLESIKSSDVKKILAPVIDFDRHTVTEIYVDTLTPEVRKALTEKRVLVGMDREQVTMALGYPQHKSRETKDGIELEDWVYGQAPGKFTFVTFKGEKVIKVKEEYAGLGVQVADPGPVK